MSKMKSLGMFLFLSFFSWRSEAKQKAHEARRGEAIPQKVASFRALLYILSLSQCKAEDAHFSLLFSLHTHLQRPTGSTVYVYFALFAVMTTDN
jgi:hypothetical protein